VSAFARPVAEEFQQVCRFGEPKDCA